MSRFRREHSNRIDTERAGELERGTLAPIGAKVSNAQADARIPRARLGKSFRKLRWKLQRNWVFATFVVADLQVIMAERYRPAQRLGVTGKHTDDDRNRALCGYLLRATQGNKRNNYTGMSARPSLRSICSTPGRERHASDFRWIMMSVGPACCTTRQRRALNATRCS